MQQHAALGFSNANSLYIPNGFDTAQFRPSAERRQAYRVARRIPAEARVIGRFGRYHPMKDFPMMVRAAATVMRQYPDCHLLLGGREVDTSNRPLMAEVMATGVAARIHLVGEETDMAAALAAVDINCSSSAWGEAFPNVIGEGMSCGVPAVATDIGDSRWILGEAGTVVPPRDPRALGEALAAMLSLPAEARDRLGAAARNRIMQSFSLAAAARAYDELYAGLPDAHGR
jgi:glycosyltransferase involved in cell wall biosynthesis